MYKKFTYSRLLFTLFSLFTFIGMATAQKGTIKGTVSDVEGPLIGASVVISGTSQGSVTDIDGTYDIIVDPGTYTIEASYIGYASRKAEVTVSANGAVDANFTLAEGLMFDEIVVTGTRASNRTNTDAPVPIDVINVSQLSSVAAQTSLNQLLDQSAPSFSSKTQTISDGTDHIDPASLRGLGPDQVLVLLNGKRRHNTSLVNVNGTFGRGSVGTDLNAIPVSAIETIEVLRDGAAAQYGSDAIAGVMNIRMKESVNVLSAALTVGGNFTSEIGAFEGVQKDVDGEVVNLGLNYGIPLGNEGGFINFSGEMDFRGSTNRMKEFSGGIFNNLNAVERIATASGVDISTMTMQQAQDAAQGVDYFSSELKSNIAGAPDMDSLAVLLGGDATNAELDARGQTRSDYNMRVGQSAVRGGKFFANMSLPVGDDMEFYSFGGIGYRRGESGCFYRLPGQNRTTTSIYPNGTVPRINSNIKDQSLATGLRGTIGDWNIDFSNVYGQNSFFYNMTNTHNATLGASSPTEFDAGGHSFAQNTSNFDLSQYFDIGSGIKGINLAFGAEYRYENYVVTPGSAQSSGNYDVNGNLVTSVTPSEDLVTDFLGRSRPSGAQCFAGFLPFNQVDANRTSAAGYVDTEFDISEAFLIGLALRYEDYSDFGSTFNYKAVARYKITDNIALRAGTSTGFRAPSLHQINFNRTSTLFELVNGLSVAQEVGLFSNNSRAAELLGIPSLKEEVSQNYSAGITIKAPDAGLKLTIDGYIVNIQDRVILTGQFAPGDDAELQSLFNQAGSTKASFFANGIDTESTGLDIVISHSARLGDGKILRSNLAATFSQTKAATDDNGDIIIHASELLERKGLVGTYFDQTSRLYLEQAVPRTKISLSNTLSLGKLDIYLRNTFFGETTEATNEAIFDADLELLSGATVDPYNDGKLITDLSLGYNFSKDMSVTIGANNLLDIYPDVADAAFQSSGRFQYSRRAPNVNINGRFLFARLAFTLK
ncbi:MAG: iron complex outermembrane receptor protein [Saprospiraceae bacterium]|jgi:iron complex outermembrane receptor protein